MTAPLGDQQRHIIVAGSYRAAVDVCREKELPIPPHRTDKLRTIIVTPHSVHMLRGFLPRAGDEMHIGYLGEVTADQIEEIERWLVTVGFKVKLF